MLQATLKKIAELRAERSLAHQSQDWIRVAELKVELDSELEKLKPVFKAMGQHVRAMNQPAH